MKEMTGASRKRRGYRALAGLLVIAVVCGGLFYAAYHRHLPLPAVWQSKMDLLPDMAARTGTPSAGERAKPLAADSFQVVINQMPVMENGAAPCNIQAENPETNPYDLRVCLYLESTGELLGATHRIERGKRVDELKLDKILLPGEYPILAQLELFDEQRNMVTQLAVSLSLLVRE